MKSKVYFNFQILKNFEIKIAELISDQKSNDELKHDIKKLGTVINEVDNNLANLRDMFK